MSPITGEDTVASLRARLEQTERQATARQRQLERYAADLREVFKQERARAQELRALLHGDRARALQRRRGARRLHRQARRARRRLRHGARARRRASTSRTRRRSSSASCCTTSARSRCPDAILFKTSSLTEEEYALIAPPPGDRLGDPARRRLPRRGQARRAPPPRALGRHAATRTASRGEEIPLAARVFAVADALDALTTDRPYRPASRVRGARARRSARRRARSSTRPSSPPTTRSPTSTFDALRDGLVMNRTILIVDDDPCIRELIATTLEDVVGLPAAGGGRRRRRRSSAPRRRSPEIVFLDIDMPRLNGIETCRRLRVGARRRPTRRS